MVFRLV